MMKSFRRNNRGQLVIIATLIMIVFTLSLVLSISKIGLSVQELKYEPFQEIVLGITSDFDRCLTRALSLATQKYSETGSLEEAEAEGNSFLAKWVNATLAAYSNLGLEIVMNASDYGGTDVLWVMDWGSSAGVSYAYTQFSLNISAYGFKGWTTYSAKTVWLNITQWDPDFNSSTVTLEFQVLQSEAGGLHPVPNLTPEKIQVKLDTIQAQNVLVDVENLTYSGYGSYSVTFGIESTDIKNITLTVTTPGDIVVSASTSGEWKSLYLTTDQEGNAILVPISQFDPTDRGKIEKHGHLTLPHFDINISSVVPTDRDINLSSYISIKLFLGKTGEDNPHEVNVEVSLGFQYGDEIYWIGEDTNQVSAGLHPYIFTINAENGEYPEGYGARVIPKGSVLILRIRANFEGGSGRIFIYYGGDDPSRIVL
ncbi:hypothetical protein J7L29_04380 [Candidatus Bathyarchaeota archaeon]|nr:hypothetical protein [Candidatus Bathyarchaeota archaeon]